MSVRVSAMVFEGGPQDLAEHSVMIALADNAGDAGEAWPGVQLLARKSRLSERHVLRVLAALEAAGWISVRRRVMVRRGHDRVCGSIYQMNLARLAAEARARGEEEMAPPPVMPRRRAVATKVSAHDTVSPALHEHRENIRQPERAHDTVSGGREDGGCTCHPAREHMTFAPAAHDMALADVFLNQADAFCNRKGTIIEPPTTPLPPACGGPLHGAADAAREGDGELRDEGENAGESAGDVPRSTNRSTLRSAAALPAAAGDDRFAGALTAVLSEEEREELADVNRMRAMRREPPLEVDAWLQLHHLPIANASDPLPRGRARRRRRSGR